MSLCLDASFSAESSADNFLGLKANKKQKSCPEVTISKLCGKE